MTITVITVYCLLLHGRRVRHKKQQSGEEISPHSYRTGWKRSSVTSNKTVIVIFFAVRMSDLVSAMLGSSGKKVWYFFFNALLGLGVWERMWWDFFSII